MGTEGPPVVSPPHVFSTLAGLVRSRGMPSVVSSTGAPHFSHNITHVLVSQTFCTTAATTGTNGDGSFAISDCENEETYDMVTIGEFNVLGQTISTELKLIKQKIKAFEGTYTKAVRPLLVSRCLVHPHALNSPLTALLHGQTYHLVKHNANFIGSFDVMAHRAGCNPVEWSLFLDHLDKKRIYIIENWDFSFSTVQPLMYDYGVIEPVDDAGLVFFKGECDGTYDPKTGTANLSFLILEGDRLFYSEVYKSVPCASATEAELFAAMALLQKAIEFGIRKLLVWSDCKTVTMILTGEMVIGRGHDHIDSYLMLRSMRARFLKLITVWKPRELMVFADDLAKLTGSSWSSKLVKQEWEHHLKGLPIFRIRRTKDANTEFNKIKDVKLDDSIAENENFIFFVEVEEDLKFDCLVALQKTFDPTELKVVVKDVDAKPDSFRKKLGEIVDLSSQIYTSLDEINSSTCSTFTSKSQKSCPTNCLVVAYNGAVPEHMYYKKDAFHVLLVTPHERNTLKKNIPELNALTFVHFHGVTYPLNTIKEGEGTEGDS